MTDDQRIVLAEASETLDNAMGTIDEKIAEMSEDELTQEIEVGGTTLKPGEILKTARQGISEAKDQVVAQLGS